VVRVQASMASGVVDVCLIPEVSFDLYGEHGVLEYVGGLLRRKGHCVICVAEGAGQVPLAPTN
jgi:6-phosphofructokinase 1